MREEEEEDSSEEENVQKLIAAAGNATSPEDSILYTGTNVSLYKADTGSIMAGDQDNKGSTNQVQWVAIVDKEGKRGKAPTANKYWGEIFGGEKPSPFKRKEGTQDEGEEGREVRGPEEDPEVMKVQQEVMTQIEAMGPQPKGAGYLNDEQMTAMMGQAQGSSKGTRVKDEEVVAEMATMGADKDPAKVLKSLKAQKNFLDTYSKWKGGGALTPEDASTLRDNLVLTPNGVKMGGYYRQYRRKPTDDNDPYMMMADELDAEIQKRGEKWSVEDDKNPFKPLKRITPPPSENGGQATANRGIIAEKLERCNLALSRMEAAEAAGDMQAVKKARAEVAETFEDAMADHSSEEVMKMFDRGNKTRLGNYIASQGDMADAEYLEGIKEILVKEHGLSPENVDKLLDLGGTKDGVGLAIVIIASRKFSKELYPEGEVMPDNIRQTGQEGAQELGEKADLIAEYDLDEGASCEEVGKAWEKKLSPAQREHYKAAEKGCPGGGIGSKELVTEGKDDAGAPTGKCEVRQELKVIEKKDGKVSFGEGTNARARKICAGTDKGGAKSQEFLKLHAERMKCFGSEGAEERACGFQEKLDKLTAPFRALLNPKTSGSAVKRGEDDKPEVEDAPQEYLRGWAQAKAGDNYTVDPPHGLNPQQYERFSEGMAALNDPTKSTPDQKKHLKKIEMELEQGQMNEMIPDGELKGEHLDYICNRLSLTGGSTHETAKIGRKLSDRIQTVGLNNAEIYGTIAGLNASPPTMKVVKHGGTYAIEDKSGTRRFNIEYHRGRMRLVSTTEVSNPISGTTDTPQQEHLLMSFLRGQANLLEKLIAQTT